SALASAGWDGAIGPIAGDSLFVVDSTVSYGDTFYFVQPQTRLEVDLAANGDRTYQLTLDYANRYPEGLPSWMHPLAVEGSVFDPQAQRLVAQPGFWGDWLRVYLPPDAANLSIEGLADAPPGYAESGRL